MNLEARAENCFSQKHVLKINGQAVGKFERRFFSEGLDLSLIGMRRLRLDKSGFFSGKFELKDAETDVVLATAAPAGIFTSTWNIGLARGQCELNKAGFFSSAFNLMHGNHLLATVNRLGICQRGWIVVGHEELEAPELLLTGLIYHVIVRRQEQAAAAAAHGS
jgi:hypothetical protein